MKVVKEEGFRALYASYRTTVVMNAPFTAVHFATYEATKRGLMEVAPGSADDERLVVHATAGAAAGALAASLTTPLDVVKTQLQCQVNISKFSKSLSTIRLSFCSSPSLSRYQSTYLTTGRERVLL